MKKFFIWLKSWNQGYCTCFWDRWRGVDISDCCAKHDDTLSSSRFFKCLSGRLDFLSAILIASGGVIGAWVRYTKQMWSRV